MPLTVITSDQISTNTVFTLQSNLVMGNITMTPTSLTVGNIVSNTTVMAVGNSFVNTTAVYVGNSTVNASLTSALGIVTGKQIGRAHV